MIILKGPKYVSRYRLENKNKNIQIQDRGLVIATENLKLECCSKKILWKKIWGRDQT